MDDDATPDLSTVTSEQLIEELAGRARALVIGFDPEADQGTYYVRRAGCILACQGLVRSLAIRCDNRMAECERELDEEDEG